MQNIVRAAVQTVNFAFILIYANNVFDLLVKRTVCFSLDISEASVFVLQYKIKALSIMHLAFFPK